MNELKLLFDKWQQASSDCDHCFRAYALVKNGPDAFKAHLTYQKSLRAHTAAKIAYDRASESIIGGNHEMAS